MCEPYRAPVVQPPSLNQLADISRRLGLGIPVQELAQYEDLLRGKCELYKKIEDMEEPSLPVKYPRTPGYRPSPEDNPYNAWYYKTDITGAPAGQLKDKKVVIKDSIAVAGVPMMCGSKLLQGYVPEYDATVVTRILDAGGHIVGKGVCEDLCFSISSHTSMTGPVLNPYDPSRSAGGSTSGVGVLIQTGEADMGMGGDQGGSIRAPASFLGIVGLKPTFGLVPYTGICSMLYSVDHTGPMARTVQDCALLLEVVAGSDNGRDRRQPEGLKVPAYSEMVGKDLGGMKIGLLTEGFDVCEPDVAELVRKAAVDKLTAAGACVKDVSVPMHKDAGVIIEVEAAVSYYMAMVKCAGFNVGHRDHQSATLTDHVFRSIDSGNLKDVAPSVKTMALMGEYMVENYGFSHAAKARNMMPLLIKAYDDVLDKYDVIIMPTVPCKPRKLPAPDAGPKGTPGILCIADLLVHREGMGYNTIAFNNTGHPSLSINAGFIQGLPVGMMITGKLFDDATVLKVAYAFEQLRDLK